MRSSHLFEIDVIGQLHVLGMNTENLKTTGRIRNANVDLTVKATEATERWVN